MKRKATLVASALLLFVGLELPALHGQSVSTNNKSSKQKSENVSNRTQNNAGKQPAAAQQADDRVRLRSRLVSLTVTVSNTKGRIISGLGKRNFEIYDDGVKQEIAQFSTDDAPITLGIIYDVSGSMEGLTPNSFIALRGFFEFSHKDDEYFIIAFSDKPQLAQDFTISPSAVTTKVMFVKAKGNTALYDAVYLGVEKARQGRHARKALLVLSDGQENHSRYSGKELRGLLEESDVPVYTTVISNQFFGLATLVDLSNWSGGLAFTPVLDGQVRDFYAQIALTLRSQYGIGFHPSDALPDTRWHKLRVRMVITPWQLGFLVPYYKTGYRGFGN